MSVFRVKLTNGSTLSGQGSLDSHARTDSFLGGYSAQRTMYAMGPGKVNRKLGDGDTFTDCNYWKRFAYPQVSLTDSFIEVVSDDGSVYVDGVQSTFPRVYNVTVAAGSTFATSGNTVDILTDNGGAATFTQIKNTGSQDVDVRLNGLTNAVMTIANGVTQIFDSGDLSITKLEFRENALDTGGSTVQVTIGVASVCNS
jgi:hypothetical protein